MNQPNIFFEQQQQQPYTNTYGDKVFLKLPSLEVLKTELRFATKYFSSYKLYQSAKWSSELLLGVTKEGEMKDSAVLTNFIALNTQNSYQFTRTYKEPNMETFDAVLAAQTLFDLREYQKTAHLLKPFIHLHQNQHAIFLYYYSLYLAAEINKEEIMIQDEQGGKHTINAELGVIERGMETMYKNNQLEEAARYLYGIVLKDQEKIEDAKKVFIGVLNDMPCFWSAWIELCKLINSEENKLQQINPHWMKNFFASSLSLEKHRNNLAIEINYGLLCFFKNSNYLINQIAHFFYNSQDFDISLEWFEKLVDLDPFRFENMDTYSNILYIKENQGELANLALRCFNNNKYATETCCVVGNYYSLMGEHLKAVNYFRKALRLDRNCLAAWTLMGHEYLEMKNIPGAIEAYRNAVEIDPKDFRAWYGLGQTYELQSMNHYALYYFTRAVMSRPKDSRMWNAMGNCYEKLGKKNEATRCYERAENGKDKEGIALFQMGKLYDVMGFQERAIQCFEENLKRKDEDQLVDKELGECLVVLASHYKKINNFDQALYYARRLQDINGPERDEANSIIYEINQLQVQAQKKQFDFQQSAPKYSSLISSKATPTSGGQQNNNTNIMLSGSNSSQATSGKQQHNLSHLLPNISGFNVPDFK